MPNAGVLVACPTFEGKRYALDAYLAAYGALDYRPRHLFMVDNTRCSVAFQQELARRGVDAVHIEPADSLWPTLNLAWSLILEKAIELGYHWILSLEADIIVPPQMLAFLVAVARGANMRRVGHDYPARASALPARMMSDLGCQLIDRDLLSDALTAVRYFPGETLFRWIEAVAGGRQTQLTGWYNIVHLDDAETRWPFEGPDVRRSLVFDGFRYPPALVDSMRRIPA